MTSGVQVFKRFFRLASTLALLAFAALSATTASAQFSDKPIRIVVPYPAGGTTDLLARAIGARMGETLGQTIVIENKAGAGGVIGAQIVAKANPDGLTLVFASIASHGIIPALQSPPPYDAVNDFAPITLAAHTPNVIMTNLEFPAKSMGELIALAKTEPGKINYGSTSHGGSGHMSEELLELMTGIKMTHVPYKGATPMLVDLMGGQISVGFDNLPSSMTFIKAGKVRALAITTAKRWPGAPDIPTVAESGVPGYEVSAWFGLLAPAGTPKPIVDALNKAAVAAIRTPSVEKYFFEQGAEPVGNTPEAFRQFLINERDKWNKLAKANNIKLN